MGDVASEYGKHAAAATADAAKMAAKAAREGATVAANTAREGATVAAEAARGPLIQLLGQVRLILAQPARSALVLHSRGWSV